MENPNMNNDSLEKYRQILGVEKNATNEDLDSAFRERMQEIRNLPGEEDGKDKIRAIVNEAYAVLTDPEMIRELDVQKEIQNEVERQIPQPTSESIGEIEKPIKTTSRTGEQFEILHIREAIERKVFGGTMNHTDPVEGLQGVRTIYLIALDDYKLLTPDKYWMARFCRCGKWVVKTLRCSICHRTICEFCTKSRHGLYLCKRHYWKLILMEAWRYGNA